MEDGFPPLHHRHQDDLVSRLFVLVTKSSFCTSEERPTDLSSVMQKKRTALHLTSPK